MSRTATSYEGRTYGLGPGYDPRPEPRNPLQPDPLPGTGDTLAPDGRPFTWGPVVAVHRVGPYAIVEYREDLSNLHSPHDPERFSQHGRTLFHPYIDDVDTHTSSTSLDSALVLAVGYRREGPNGQAAGYFDKMTGAAS